MNKVNKVNNAFRNEFIHEDHYNNQQTTTGSQPSKINSKKRYNNGSKSKNIKNLSNILEHPTEKNIIRNKLSIYDDEINDLK